MNIKYMFFILYFTINYSVIRSGKVVVEDIEDLKVVDRKFMSALEFFDLPEGSTLTTAQLLEIVGRDKAWVLNKYAKDNKMSTADINNINEVLYKDFLEYIIQYKQHEMAEAISSQTDLKL